ncbi:MAG: hypothetical protein A2341_12610 [Deltaproteobacteria bacterium RIFOXYB12_FULL_58_9]|nr:MAG: hypothetical protein A2341_12610 [Deltaproteobacteria bacterium RIFOXYB12_FULL_58_9]
MPTLREIIASSLELIKKLEGVAGEVDNAELIDGLASLREQVQRLREEVLDLSEKDLELRKRVETLESSLVMKPDLVRHKGVYWIKGDSEPWCPVCWDKDQTALHLNRTDLMAGRLCACPQCGYNVNLDNTYPPREWSE